jgi:hypothetical protein
MTAQTIRAPPGRPPPDVRTDAGCPTGPTEPDRSPDRATEAFTAERRTHVRIPAHGRE